MVFDKFAGGFIPEHFGTSPETAAVQDPESLEPIYGLVIPWPAHLRKAGDSMGEYFAVGGFLETESRTDQIMRAFSPAEGSLIHRFRKDQASKPGKYAMGRQLDPQWTDGLRVQPLDPKVIPEMVQHLLPNAIRRATFEHRHDLPQLTKHSNRRGHKLL